MSRKMKPPSGGLSVLFSHGANPTFVLAGETRDFVFANGAVIECEVIRTKFNRARFYRVLVFMASGRQVADARGISYKLALSAAREQVREALV